jgi:hypothetical protein
VTTKLKDSTEKQRERYRRWQSQAPADTRVLSELVLSKIVPYFEASGFQRVGIALGLPDQSVARNAVCLERKLGFEVDAVDIWFDKYDRARFQIGFSRRKQLPPNEFIRSGNFVAKPSQYYCFWGKPILLPSWLWTEKMADTEVSYIADRLGQILTFFETELRSQNISRPVEMPSVK